MPSKIKRLIRTFGLVDGLRFYTHLKFKGHGWFYSNKFKAGFYLRPNTPDYYTFRQVFVHNQYDIPLPFKPVTIIDGGSNIGLASVFFANRYPEASIVAVEPSARNVEIIKRNTASYHQVKLLNKGIWNKDVSLKITNTDGSENAFMVIETTENDPDAIPAISIETIMQQEGWSTIDILKLDIEGSEKEVFESGYEYWLPRTKAIYLEMHDHMRHGASKAVFKAISQYNFSFDMKDENLIFINRDLVK